MMEGTGRQLRKRAQQEINTPEPTRRKRQKFDSKSNPDPASKLQAINKTQTGPTFSRANTRNKTRRSISQKPKSEPTPKDKSHPPEENKDVIVAEDHLCPICHLLLYQPVQTKCQHRLCQACMEHWADISASGMVIMDLDETALSPNHQSPTGVNKYTSPTDVFLEARCPMCRMQTNAEPDIQYGKKLATAYPQTWASRAAEQIESGNGELTCPAQNLTVYIGNRHAMVSKMDRLEHEWTFFVRPSRTDVIEEIQIQLYPSTRRSPIIQQRVPYEIRRTGGSCFMVVAYMILKAGYSWISDDAVDSPDGAAKGMLSLDWVLDFVGSDGKGSMGRCVLKVKNDREWSGGGREEEKDRREWDRLVRAYHRDGRYEPPDDDD